MEIGQQLYLRIQKYCKHNLLCTSLNILGQSEGYFNCIEVLWNWGLQWWTYDFPPSNNSAKHIFSFSRTPTEMIQKQFHLILFILCLSVFWVLTVRTPGISTNHALYWRPYDRTTVSTATLSVINHPSAHIIFFTWYTDASVAIWGGLHQQISACCLYSIMNPLPWQTIHSQHAEEWKHKLTSVPRLTQPIMGIWINLKSEGGQCAVDHITQGCRWVFKNMEHCIPNTSKGMEKVLDSTSKQEAFPYKCSNRKSLCHFFF